MENKTSEESRGLGDTIAKITHALGIDKVAEKVSEAVGADDCGCKRRQEKLNELVPYKKEEKQTE